MPVVPIAQHGHFDRPLSNLAVRAFRGEGTFGYLARYIFPTVDVEYQSDKYYVIDPDTWLLLPNTRRAPKTVAKKVEFKTSSDSYYAENYALGADTALEHLANADAAIRLRENKTRLVTDGLLRDFEVRTVNKVTSITNLGSGVNVYGSGSNLWWTSTGSADILGQISTGQAFMRQKTGIRPNTLILDADSFELARRNTRLIEFFKYVEAGLLTTAQLTSLFGIPNILVSDAIYNPAGEGLTGSRSNIWGANALLCYLNPGPVTLETVTFGLGFSWKPEGFPTPMQVYRSREDMAGSKHVENIEAQYYQDEKIVAKDLSYLITGTH